MIQRRTDADSVCVGGNPVDIYWRFCTAADQAGHIREIEDAGVEVIRNISSGNPWTLESVRGRIRALLKRAAQGSVRPRDDLRVLRSGMPVPNLYELRWPSIEYEERRPPDHQQQPRRLTTGLRLIHVEPPDLPHPTMVGLVMHEKAPTAEAKAEQDKYIDDAITMEGRCRDSNWGVQLRQ